jgi:hypothetical protein
LVYIYLFENLSTTVIEEQKTEKYKLEVGAEIEIEQPDSPMAVIDSKESSSDIVHLNDLENDDLSLPDISLYDLEQDDEQIKAKICLRKNGLWTDRMEKSWLKMLEQETKLILPLIISPLILFRIFNIAFY